MAKQQLEKYYMLYQKERKKWLPQFGSWRRAEVAEEERSYRDSNPDLKAEDFKILTSLEPMPDEPVTIVKDNLELVAGMQVANKNHFRVDHRRMLFAGTRGTIKSIIRIPSKPLFEKLDAGPTYQVKFDGFASCFECTSEDFQLLEASSPSQQPAAKGSHYA